MIVVTGSVTARGDSLDEIRTLSLETCTSLAQRARVHLSCRACRLRESAGGWCFIEQWADRAALLAHFAVPASRDFVRALQPLAAASTTIEIYDATKLEGSEQANA